jgi:hypothetical protein
MYLAKFKLFTCIALTLFYATQLLSQNSFVTKFSSLANEGGSPFIQNADHNYVGIVTKGYGEDLFNRSYYLYHINEYGDTTLNRKFEKADTILRIHTVTQINTNPIQYMVTGELSEGTEPSPPYFTYFVKIDENFNTVWEKIFQLRPSSIFFDFETWQNLLQKQDSGYIFATNIHIPGDERLVLFELSEQGDSMNYRMYEGDSAGNLLFDITYNYDSTAYLIYTGDAHPIPFIGQGQCITLDFDFNQTSVYHYPRWFDDGLSAKLLPDGQLITGGLYQNAEPPPLRAATMAVYKHDTSFNQLAECHVSDPDYDIRKDNGRKSLDFYYPNSIFVAGTFDYEVGEWIPRPSWIVIGKMDSDLNLLSEKYIGGDAYYHLSGILATHDGGVLISTTRYDYLTQDHEKDKYIIKLDSLDLIVGISEQKNKSVANALVYPNPASKNLFVRTAISNACFIIYDMGGEKIKEISLTGLITRIAIKDLPNGTYVWHVCSQSKIIETGKFIKTD